jgi:hypothetical protein
LPRDRNANVRLVLVVADDEHDRLAEHRAAEVFDRHPRNFHSPRTRHVGVRSRLVV